jgi:hypothetical protein
MKLQMKLMVIVASRITSALKGWYGRAEKYGIDCLETPHICLGPGIPTVDHTLIPNSSETRPHVALYEATRQVRIKCSVEKILGLDGVHHPLHSFLQSLILFRTAPNHPEFVCLDGVKL